MQTSEKAGLAFWHGELENDVMRGVLSKHPDQKTHNDFSFYSFEKKEYFAPSPPAEAVKPAPAAPEPATEEPAPAKPTVEQKVAPPTAEETTEEETAPKKKRSLWW
jgi:hypothetical protein